MNLSRNQDVAKEISKNFLMGIGPVRAMRQRQGRTSAAMPTQDNLGRYAFDPVLCIFEILPDMKGLDVFEIGPGDHLASGFVCLGTGARRYETADRFLGDVSGPVAKSWYRAVKEHWQAFLPDHPFEEGLDPDAFPEGYPDRVLAQQIAVESLEKKTGFDVVYSFHVGEHVSDIDAFARSTFDLLKPGGVAIHHVNYGPHDCWLTYDDPWTFLGFSDSVWKMMGSNRGTPNRFRHHEFVAAFEKAGLVIDDTKIEHLPPPANHVAERFRDMTPEQLSVLNSLFKLRKPAA